MGLCGARDRKSGFFCTKWRGHQDEHVATIGAYPGAGLLARWPNREEEAVGKVETKPTEAVVRKPMTPRTKPAPTLKKK